VEAGYRVIAPDLRGFLPTTFLSDDTPRSGQLSALGRDMVDLVHALHLDQPVLVGHDWGARAVANACGLQPGIASHMVLLSVGLATLIGVPIGMRAATHPNGWFDQISRFGSLAGFSMPTYWMGLMAIFVFFYVLLCFFMIFRSMLMLRSCYFMALSLFFPPSTFCGPNVVRQLLSRVGPLGLHRCYVQFYVFRCLTFVVVELSKTVRLTFIISLSSCFMWFSLVCYLGRLLVLSDIPATPATRPVTNTRPHLRHPLKHTYDTL
jgi:hypothetical protein